MQYSIQISREVNEEGYEPIFYNVLDSKLFDTEEEALNFANSIEEISNDMLVILYVWEDGWMDTDGNYHCGMTIESSRELHLPTSGLSN